MKEAQRPARDQATAVRHGSTADADALTAIFLAARRRSMSYLPTLHSDADTRWWMECVVLARSEVLVAIRGGEIAGFAALGAGSLDHLYVAPAFQSAGIGSTLVQMAQARRTVLTLHVFEWNAGARRFYGRHGFAVTGGSDGSGNEEGLPDLEMTWHAAAP